jgi:hypothetical protein
MTAIEQPDLDFPFANQDAMVHEAVHLLVDADPPKGCNLVVPPGFGTRSVARQVRDALHSHPSRPLLAFLEADAVVNAEAFILDLHDQWNRCLKAMGASAGLPTPRPDLRPHEALKFLLVSLPADRRVVVVFDRFHKILDHLDQWVLAQLRTAEEDRRLCALTLTPLRYSELKKRWRQDHPLTVSDFGDKHARFEVGLGTGEQLGEQCRALALPGHLARYAIALTGGYPELMHALLDEWQRRKRTYDLGPDVKLAYRQAAEQSAERLIEWLDVSPDTTFRDAVIDLYQGVDVERAASRLQGHPFERLLLDGDGELRSECVGAAAVQIVCRGSSDKQAAARRLYERHQYAQAAEIMRDPQRRLPGRVLQAHARIMAALYDEEGDEKGLDTEWKRLCDEIAAARKQLGPDRTAIPDFACIEDRYHELEEAARTILGAVKSDRPQNRVVDVLAGLYERPTTDEHRRMAFMVLVRQAEAARATVGHTTACLAVLALPEQIFRVWAFCTLGLNYYQPPTGEDDVWDEAERAWQHGALNRSFNSLPAFAYFALAKHRQLARVAGSPPPLEDDFAALQKSLSQWNQVRTDPAHAVVVTRKSAREQYFQLIDRWLDRALAACCPGQTRLMLRAIFDPLPLADNDGSLVWIET